MKRRHFLALGAGLGGGAVLAAASPLLALADSRYPEAAVAPWQGPPADSDLRRWALGYAVLAPSPHNRQSWLVDLSEPGTITLWVDRTRLLPVTDPHGRQILIGQGTFLEALTLALRARALRPMVQLFPPGAIAGTQPVARVTWTSGDGRPDPLFAHIRRRHTAKIDYDTARPVAPSVLGELASALTDSPVRLGGTVEPGAVAVLRGLTWAALRTELLTPPAVLESLQLLRVGPDEIAAHRDGISVNAPAMRVIRGLGLLDRDTAPTEDSVAFKGMAERMESHCRTAMGFVWLTTKAGAGAEVAAGRAFLRLQLKATELGLQMHPLSQALQEYPAMQPYYRQAHDLLAWGGETVQMLCRIGYGASQQHEPRRGVDAIIKL